MRIEQSLECMTDGFVLLDSSWRIVYINRHGAEISGRSVVELIGRNHWDEFPKACGGELESRYRRAMETGETEHFEYYYPVLRRWFELHAYPGPAGLAVYFRDISDRKQVQELLASFTRTERAYRAALANTPDLVYVFDLDHRFTYANPALLAMWGRTWEEAIGKNCLELGYPDWHAAMHDREIEQVVATREPIRGEVPFAGTNGRRIYDYIFVPVLGSNGEVEAIAGTTRDVTERRQAEQTLLQTEKLAAVGRLASSIAHEINNPLEAVTNLLYLARQEAIEPNVRAYLESADRELRRMSVIANQTLRFHRQATRPQAVLCEELSASVVDIYDRRLRNMGIRVEKRHRALEPVVCLEGEIRQVLNNLISNAMDAMPGGGRLLLRSRKATDWKTGCKGVSMTVADTGSGIAPETLGRVFEPFFTTKGIGGTGLGMWISAEIMERQQGRLRVRSSQQEPHRGTVVTLFLPEKTAAGSDPEKMPQPEATPDATVRAGAGNEPANGCAPEGGTARTNALEPA